MRRTALGLPLAWFGVDVGPDADDAAFPEPELQAPSRRPATTTRPTDFLLLMRGSLFRWGLVVRKIARPPGRSGPSLRPSTGGRTPRLPARRRAGAGPAGRRPWRAGSAGRRHIPRH